MKSFITLSIIALLYTIPLLANQATIKIPHTACSKYPYAHTIGGTAHSRLVQKSKLERAAKKLSAYNKQDVITRLQAKYPNLGIHNVDIKIKNCGVYYQSRVADKTYLFDAGTFDLRP